MNSVSDLRLCDIASSDVLTVSPESWLAVAIAKFVESHVSCLIALEHGKPVGILTERDLVYLMGAGSIAGKTVRDVMSAPLLTTLFDLDFAAAHYILANRGIRHLVLVDEAGALKGVASESDFHRHLGDDLLDEIPDSTHILDQRIDLISPDLPLSDVLKSMSSRWVDCVVIGRDGVAEGIVTERDIPKFLIKDIDPAVTTVGEVMTHPLVSVDESVALTEAVHVMMENNQRHLVVTNKQGRFVGVMSQHRVLERLGVMLIEDSRRNLASQLNLVLESTGLGTWEYDCRRAVFIRSEALNKVMRFAEDYAYEKLDTLIERTHPDDQMRVRQAFEGLIAGTSQGLNIDFQVQGGDGRTRWVSSRGQVLLRDDAGVPLRLAGVAIDIHQQKSAEIERQRSDERFYQVIEKIGLPVAYINIEREVKFVNQQFIDTFGYALEDVPTVDQWNVLAYPDVEYRTWAVDSWLEAFESAKEAGRVISPPERQVRCKNGEVKFVQLTGVVLDGKLLVTLLDVTERHHEKAMLEFSNTILRHVSVGTALPETLNAIAFEVEKQVPGTQCSILLLSTNGKSLHHGAAPSLPAAYCQAIDGVKIGPTVGSCGTAAFRGEPVFVGDIASDPLWADYKVLAGQYDLAACWSRPIFSTSHKMLGSFAVYWSKTVSKVDPVVEHYISTAATLAGIAIEESLREGKLQATTQRLQRAEEISRCGSWTLDLKTGVVRASKQMFRLFNQGPEKKLPPTFDAFLALAHPADHHLLISCMQQMSSRATPESFVYRRHPDLGELCYLEVSFSMVRDKQGECIGFDGVLMDVTKRRLGDEKLRQQLDELRRWQQMTLGRESRVLELKREINAILVEQGRDPRYQSVTDEAKGKQ